MSNRFLDPELQLDLARQMKTVRCIEGMSPAQCELTPMLVTERDGHVEAHLLLGGNGDECAALVRDLPRADAAVFITEGYAQRAETATAGVKPSQAFAAGDLDVQEILMVMVARRGKIVGARDVAFVLDDQGMPVFGESRRIETVEGPMSEALIALTGPVRR